MKTIILSDCTKQYQKPFETIFNLGEEMTKYMIPGCQFSFESEELGVVLNNIVVPYDNFIIGTDEDNFISFTVMFNDLIVVPFSLNENVKEVKIIMDRNGFVEIKV